MAQFDKKPDLMETGRVTDSLDYAIPDKIIEIIGRDLKMTYLSKRRCLLVLNKDDKRFDGEEAVCTQNNVLILNDRLKKGLRLEVNMPISCEYSGFYGYLIIKKIRNISRTPSPPTVL